MLPSHDHRRHADDEGWGLAGAAAAAAAAAEEDIVAAEYAAYYQRREERRRQQSAKRRMEFDQIAVRAERKRRESMANSSEQGADADDADDADDLNAAQQAARKAVRAMSEEEREAVLARHEERSARSQYDNAIDWKPEALDLSSHVRDRLNRAVEDWEDARSKAAKAEENGRLTQDGIVDDPVKKVRSESSAYTASYFASVGKDACDDDDAAASYRNVIAQRKSSPAYQAMLGQRKKLPAHRMANTLADALLHPRTTMAVVSGETGCGKTTQIPRILAEAAADRGMGRLHILVAQPRRIAAVGVAERVAEEGGTGRAPGDDGCDVGYHIRHERRVGRAASVVFATTGVVLRILAGDPDLGGVDVVILDEVHERSSDGDFLMAALRDLVTAGSARGPGSERPLKLVLMSATVDSDFFVNYLKEGGNTSRRSDEDSKPRATIPVIHIEGRAYPVEDFYLEDAIEAIVSSDDSMLQSSDDMFDLDLQAGRRKKQKQKRNGKQHAGKDEALVRESRYDFLEKQFSSDTADFVSDFDKRAKVPAKDCHLKSISSGDLPLGLAFHLVFHLDRLHRPQDDGDGAILVFLPGYDDIAKLNDAFKQAADNSGGYANDANNLHVLCLHGSMPTSEQRAIFRKPPAGKRKVVLSTNVAESSITVEDVVFCLDLGKHKEKTYDPQSHIECLLPTWISKASARQRRGRAGRVRKGQCWHLYPSWYLKEGSGTDLHERGSFKPGGEDDPEPAFVGDVKFRAFSLPEMLRTPLEDVCLRARFLGLADRGSGGVERFISSCPSPPGPLTLHNAMEALSETDMQLMRSDTEELTQMGRAVASMPLPPRIGLFLLLSDYLGCEDTVLTLCAILSGRSLFYAPFEKKAEADKKKRAFAEDVASDLFASIRAYDEWERAEEKGDGWPFCRQNFLSRQALLTARANRRQLVRDLNSSKLEIFGKSGKTSHLPSPKGSFDDDSERLWHEWGRVLGALAASFGGSHLARLDHNGSGKIRCPIYTKSHGRVKLFPSSVSSPDGAGKEIASRGTTYYLHRFGIYVEKVRNAGGISLYDLSEVGPLALSICVPGERMYQDHGKAGGKNKLLPIGANNGKVIWSDEEVEAMTSRRGHLKTFTADGSISDVDRVAAQLELEDLEIRLGITDAIGAGSAEESLDSKVLSFVVSALEQNGGSYPMAQLRRMMKSDYALYEAMGPVRKFASEHSDVLSLDKIGGKWMFVLKPGANVLEGRLRSSESATGDGDKLFYGVKDWVYFALDDKERSCIDNVRSTFHSIVDAGVSGQSLLPEEERFLDTLGWALEEDFTKSGC